MKIFINGFGRIGRTILRQLLLDPAHSDIEIVGLNDIAPRETCAYLFKYDSVFGTYPGQVAAVAEALQIDTVAIPLWQSDDIARLDLTGVDVVLECTGKANTPDVAERGLSAGARAVLISGPSDAAHQTIVLGANEELIGEARVISNASCTTNAIAPLLKALDDAAGVMQAHITTIHCYTGSQPTVDAPASSLERSRAAAVSMVPTSTSAASQIGRVLPQMDGKISVSAVRVPCISVSAVDAILQLSDMPHSGIDHFLRTAFDGAPIIGTTQDPCVSSDLRARPESLIIALPETQIVGSTQVRVFGWYDNEWGFSARMIDMVRKMSARPAP